MRYIGLPVHWHNTREHRKVAATGVLAVLLTVIASRRTDDEPLEPFKHEPAGNEPPADAPAERLHTTLSAV